jgi:hypothetical protein
MNGGGIDDPDGAELLCRELGKATLEDETLEKANMDSYCTQENRLTFKDIKTLNNRKLEISSVPPERTT